MVSNKSSCVLDWGVPVVGKLRHARGKVHYDVRPYLKSTSFVPDRLVES